ncbi:transcription activator effector-binding protein [Seonamhaeicola algicola]|uniref:Transcription activator effector-binding protein n=1 Tax=Seonamhaeicola algicola TaxID=1719036 RepID=A0A5C7AR14_9FLAO|nr:GyrI-like domain-containing protein [Seonamhaeicola algicola]TXE11118.1 transcription activator effector-binding protein [Seonamhaeicola algicola]
MKFLKYILFFLLIAIIGTAIYVAVQPNEYEFSRSRNINAPAVLLFNKVNDYKNWPEFSPWMEHEPNASLSYGNKTSGVGGSYAWSGDILGEGNMETLAVTPNSNIEQRIEFIKPFESESDITWHFETTQTGTQVTWAMKGKQDFMTKLFTTFMGSIEENTAPDFDRGLFKLDSIITASMKKFSININGETEYGGGFYMYKTTSATGANISQIMGKQYGEIMAYMAKNNIVANGMPFTIYNEMNPETGNIIMSNAIPVMNKITVEDGSEILCGFIPNIKTLKTTLKGNYTNLPKAWEASYKYIAENGLEAANFSPFEVYTNDPGDFPNPADWITEIYIPIK